MTSGRWPDGCPRDGHVLDGICALAKVETEPPALLSWHYGPTDTDPNPGSMWHYGCGGEVMLFDGHAVCGCGAQVCESPADCGDDDCDVRERPVAESERGGST